METLLNHSISRPLKSDYNNYSVTKPPRAALGIDQSLRRTNQLHQNKNSKLSLDSLINIATVLEASTDEILFGRIQAGADHRYDEVLDIFSDCDKTELRILIKTSCDIKEVLRDEKKRG